MRRGYFAWSLTLLIILVAAAISAPADIAEGSVSAGLSAYYPLDRNALDLSGHAMNGVVQGATPVADRFGDLSSAMYFSGAGSRISVPDTALLGPARITITAWVRPDAVGKVMAIVDKLDAAGGYYLRVLADGRVDFYATGASDPIGTEIPPGAWRHVAASFDGDYQRIYIDGELKSEVSRAGTMPPSYAPLTMGQAPDGTLPFSGAIDELRIYARALSDTEVAQVFYDWDKVAPVVGVSTPTSGAKLTGKNYDVTGFASDPGGSGVATVEVSYDGGKTWSAASDTSVKGDWSTWSFMLDPIPLGNHSLRPRATDRSGNTGLGAKVAVLADNAPPAGSVTIDGGAAVTNSFTVSLVISATDDYTGVAEMKVSADSPVDSAPWEAFNTTKTVTLPSGEGGKTVYARFKDGAGNVSDVVSSQITVTSKPYILSVTPPHGIEGTPVKVTGVNLGTSGTLYIGSARARARPWAPTSVTFVTPRRIPYNIYDIHVVTGGVASNSVTYVVSQPRIASLEPPSGSSGTQVTLHGENFGRSGYVRVVNYDNGAAKRVRASSFTDTAVTFTITSVVPDTSPEQPNYSISLLTPRVESNGIWFTGR